MEGGKINSNPFSKEQKKFSVCTPCYKDTYKFFKTFFLSLDQQDYKHFETIVVFDGPNPEGERELKKCMKKYPKLDVKHTTQEWGGAPKARNTAASLATGDYLTFLDPDIYPYPQTFRQWANAFELNPDKDVIWGQYEMVINGKKYAVGGQIPVDNGGNVQYYAFRASNYCSGAFPVRKEAFIGWDETVKSLQDWDMWMRMLKEDDFEGKKFLYTGESHFMTEPPQEGGISEDSAKNWKERVKYIRKKNGVPIPDTCVCSLGAPYHGVNIAKMLGADYLPMPSFKPNDYKTIYLAGFYTAGEGSARSHMDVFAGNPKSRKIVHWIGTDVYQMHHNASFQKLKQLKKWFKNTKVIHLTELQRTYDEMAELGIRSKIVPIPPSRLFEPMPLPEKFTVAVYLNETQKMYAESLMEEVARSMPDVKFVFFGDDKTKGKKYGNVEHIGWADIEEVIKQSSCNLRITVHDGLPLTPIQFLTAGRQVVSNSKLHGAIHSRADRREIIEKLREAQRTVFDPKISEYWRSELDPKKFKKNVGGL